MILALAGGVGGSRFANGLANCLTSSNLMIAVNTGDDFEHLGLFVSPDLDTVMYTLAGRNNPATGWGLANESWHFMDALGSLGGETWFQLGDHDLATHVQRTQRMRDGDTLSEVTSKLCAGFGVQHPIVPMSDQRVATFVTTNVGRLAFQDYLVRHRCLPIIQSVEFAGAAHALPSPALAHALADSSLQAIVIAPSNPYLSIGPILAVPGVREAIATTDVPVVAVSPIIAGEAVKGPLAKMLREFGHTASASTIAMVYGGLLDGLVIDERDRDLCGEIEAQGVAVHVTDTLMRDTADQARLAHSVLEFVVSLPRPLRRKA
jgi:LPPG:FO 2-phospho-L-lactate transferase